jgi:hypothetical protein
MLLVVGVLDAMSVAVGLGVSACKAGDSPMQTLAAANTRIPQFITHPRSSASKKDENRRGAIIPNRNGMVKSLGRFSVNI